MNAPIFSLNPRGTLSQVVTASLPLFGVCRKYLPFENWCRPTSEIDKPARPAMC